MMNMKNSSPNMDSRSSMINNLAKAGRHLNIFLPPTEVGGN
jgi:hypothetical protein